MMGALVCMGASAGDGTYVVSVSELAFGSNPVRPRAYVATTLPSGRLDELPFELKALCAKYPKLDQYSITVVSDPEVAHSQAFRDFQATLVVRPQRDWEQYRGVYVAEYTEGTMTLFPADPKQSRTIRTSAHWCRQ